MVVVRRVLHGLGEPGGVGVPWRYDPSPASCCWPPLITPGAPPLLTGDFPALLAGDAPVTLPLTPTVQQPPAYWLGASKRWTGRGEGTGEAEGVLLLLLLNGWGTKPWWWLPGLKLVYRLVSKSCFTQKTILALIYAEFVFLSTTWDSAMNVRASLRRWNRSKLFITLDKLSVPLNVSANDYLQIKHKWIIYRFIAIVVTWL